MRTTTYDIIDTPHPRDIKRPPIYKESHSFVQPLRLVTSLRRLTRQKPGNGERVMLIPGWKSPQSVMFPLKVYLSKLGYSPKYWGIGFNNGQVERYRDILIEELLNENNSEKITLIGWSLGGVVAREVARSLPKKVAGVITYGTPVIGGPKYTIGAKSWGKEEAKRIIALTEELDHSSPITVPISTIFTKKDSIVNWSACIDHKSPNVTHYEVKSTHLSLGIDPEVWNIISNHLKEYAE